MTDQALLIHGGRVLVLDHDIWDAEAVVVRGGRVEAVGALDAMRRATGSSSRKRIASRAASIATRARDSP